MATVCQLFILIFCYSEDYGLTDAAFAIIRGRAVPADLATIQMQNGRKVYMTALSSWGYVADVDIESERFRKLGETRFILGALKTIAQRRVYPGRFQYLPFEEEEKNEIGGGGEVEGGLDNERGEGKMQHEVTCSTQEESVKQNGEQQHQSELATDLLPPLSDPVPSRWKTIEGNFVLFVSLMVPYLGHGFTGDVSLTMGSGKMHIMYSLDTSRKEMLTMLLTAESGSYLQREETHVVKTRAYRLEPLTSQGIVTVDGEMIEYGPHQVQVHPQLVRIMSRRRRGKEQKMLS